MEGHALASLKPQARILPEKPEMKGVKVRAGRAIAFGTHAGIAKANRLHMLVDFGFQRGQYARAACKHYDLDLLLRQAHHFNRRLGRDRRRF